VARPPSGAVLEKQTKTGRVFALRFSAYGQRRYVTLDVTSRAEAEQELQNVLADVRRGIWKPPVEPVVELTVDEPTFHAYASEWVARRRHEVDARSAEHWQWALSNHLLAFFADYRPSQITGRLVDQYKTSKLEQGSLAAASINKTLKVLAQILDDAVEDRYLTENPARGKRRRLKAERPTRTWLELDEVTSLIDAAGDHRALLATMTLGGLRVSELTALRWRDVDLAGRRITVADSKTDAGRRVVDATPWLAEELATHKSRTKFTEPGDFVFATRNGTARQRSNVTRQILTPAIANANKQRLKAGLAPIRSAVTNHSLRRTFASLLYEAGASPAYVMAQMGHTSSQLALEVYAKVMQRARETGERVDALVRGPVLAPIGTGSSDEVEASSSLQTETPPERGF